MSNGIERFSQAKTDFNRISIGKINYFLFHILDKEPKIFFVSVHIACEQLKILYKMIHKIYCKSTERFIVETVDMIHYTAAIFTLHFVMWFEISEVFVTFISNFISG